jgi:hypothetical protein
VGAGELLLGAGLDRAGQVEFGDSCQGSQRGLRRFVQNFQQS